MDFILNAIVWAIIGAVPGYYVAYGKRHDPRLGMIIGAIGGVIIGEIGIRAGIMASTGSAIVAIFGLAVIAALLLPFGEFESRMTARSRITYLAYALTVPTMLIVLGIVIFPLIWNVIFSVRSIEVADLADVELFNLTELTGENYAEQVGFRIDSIDCIIDETTGECAVDEDGNIEYPRVRDVVGREDYGRYREVNELDIFGTHYVISVADREFYPMIWRTFFYTITSTIFAILFGLIAALVVRDKFPGRTVFRGFILFPYIAPVISVAFIWQVLLQQNGLVNQTLGTDTAFLSTRDSILGISVPMLTLIAFQTWRYFPFAFLFLLARIQAIPDDMYEAAKVDGAAPSQRLLYITLPQLRAIFGTLFLLRFIWTFNKFEDVYLLTGPITQTKVISVQIFETLFTERNVGQASAIAVIMAVMLAVVLSIYFRYFLVEEE